MPWGRMSMELPSARSESNEVTMRAVFTRMVAGLEAWSAAGLPDAISRGEGGGMANAAAPRTEWGREIDDCESLLECCGWLGFTSALKHKKAAGPTPCRFDFAKPEFTSCLRLSSVRLRV